MDSAAEAEPSPSSAPAASAAPADCFSNSPATGVVSMESEEDEKDNALNHSQPKEETVVVVVSDKTEKQERMRDEEVKETGAPAAETGTVYLI